MCAQLASITGKSSYSLLREWNRICWQGVQTLAEQLTNFSELGHMPIDVDIKQLDNGDGIEATLMRHHAG